MADLAAVSVYVHRNAGGIGLQAVQDFAVGEGLLVTAAVPSRRCVLLSGERTAIGKAFTPIPDTLAGQIEAVLGPDAVAESGPAPHPCIAIVQETGVTPQALAASLPAGDGSGHCIGVLSFGGIVGRAALTAACAALGVAVPSPLPHVVSIDAAATVPAGPDGTLLPILIMLAALVPKAKIVVYAAPPSQRGWVDALSAAIHDPSNRPSVICSGESPPETVMMAETLAQDAARLGVQLYLPTGDPQSRGLASPEPGKAWVGAGIDAVLQAVARLRTAAQPPPASPLHDGQAAAGSASDEPAPLPRPHYDAVTTAPRPLVQLHRAMVAYETDRYPGPLADGALPVSWRLLPGSMATDIAVGGDGSIWALGVLPGVGGFPLFRWNGFGWVPVAAAGTALAMDGYGQPWVVSAFGTLFRFNGTDWRVVRAGVHDVAIGAHGAIWALSGQRGDDGRAVLHRPAPAHRHDEPAWSQDGMCAERIATAPDGTPWIVNDAGEALRWDGTQWVCEATNVHDIAVQADGQVWAISRRGRRLYRRAPADGGWLRADGVADRLVALGGGLLWAVTPHGFVAAGTPMDEPSGHDA